MSLLYWMFSLEDLRVINGRGRSVLTLISRWECPRGRRGCWWCGSLGRLLRALVVIITSTHHSRGADWKTMPERLFDLISEGHSRCPAPDIIQSVSRGSDCCVMVVTSSHRAGPPVVRGGDVVVAGSSGVAETRIFPFSMSKAALQCYHRHSSAQVPASNV